MDDGKRSLSSEFIEMMRLINQNNIPIKTKTTIFGTYKIGRIYCHIINILGVIILFFSVFSYIDIEKNIYSKFDIVVMLLSGVVLLAVSQITRATLDTADYARQHMIMMQLVLARGDCKNFLVMDSIFRENKNIRKIRNEFIEIG